MAPAFVVPVNNPIYIFKTYNQHIECRVIGGPRPTITWFHNDTELIGDDSYVVLADGTLRIKKVTDKYAGTYKCLATNSIGTVESEGVADLVGKLVLMPCN